MNTAFICDRGMGGGLEHPPCLCTCLHTVHPVANHFLGCPELSCKPKPKRDKNGKTRKRPRASGSTRDDAPNYDKPIYDRSGNQIGVIYDPPPMGGPSGLS